MSVYPLLIDPAVKAQLAELVRRAEAPASLVTMERLQTLTRDPGDARKVAHMAQMTAQTVDIPLCYCVTYSVEEQPFGRARHMSLSITRAGALLPHATVLWAVAHLLGFWGELCECEAIYPERLKHGQREVQAMNLIQRFDRPTPP